jgi:hypothetical protein
VNSPLASLRKYRCFDTRSNCCEALFALPVCFVMCVTCLVEAFHTNTSLSLVVFGLSSASRFSSSDTGPGK